MKRAFLACAVAVLVAVSGCGSVAGTGAGTIDPATLAPPGALAYATFQVAPQGPEKANFDAAFSKLLGADPETKLGQAFTKAAQTSGKLDYQADVKPWLGDSISVVVTRVGLHDGDFAMLVASTDDAKAQAAIDKDLAGVHTDSRSYRDVSYEVLDDGTVNGIVSHFLVAGTEPAFKAVVDASKDGNSLAGSDQWKKTVGDRANGKVGLAYVDAKGLLQSLASNLPGMQRVTTPLLLGLLQLHPFVATLDAKPDSLVVDASSPGTPADPRGPGAASSPLIESLPTGSWLAAAMPDVGQALGTIAGALQANPLIGGTYAHVVDQIRARTGLDLDKDVLAAVGDVGVYVQGTTLRTVRGGAVIESPKPATLARTLRRVPALINRNADGHVVAAARVGGFDVKGRRMAHPFQVRRAPHMSGKLGQTDLFKKAAAAIGERPTLFVDFAKALALAARSPHHSSDADFKQALPRLRRIEFVAAGARRDGGLDVLRGVLGLR
ncbi:MAG TPA: DUF3352 domain-containing protein [Thermoleophilaceae bacterium]|nr:DUF3352 domain-containing protein [Thermoleophilaceae bacterium]